MGTPTTFLSNRNFHRLFILTADPTANRPSPIRVTYSDIGYGSQSSPTDPSLNTTRVVVFLGGLMGGRYSLLRLHHHFTRLQIRLITIDRSGLGGSSPTPVHSRLLTHLLILPLLLNSLSIPHIALLSHSGGSLYALNTILQHRSLLHPTRPYICMLAPWVHPKHSGNLSMRITSALGRGAIGNFDGLARFVHGYWMPVMGAVGAAGGIFGPGEGKGQKASPAEVDKELDVKKEEGKSRVDDAWMQAVGTLTGKYIFLEDISGSSDEALFLLKKAPKAGLEVARWGGKAWDEYEEALDLVVEGERKVQGEQEVGRRLHVDVWHADKDQLIGSNGRKGSKYFDGCWNRDDVRETIEYESRICKGTDHDGILDPGKMGAVKVWCEKMAKIFDEAGISANA